MVAAILGVSLLGGLATVSRCCREEAGSRGILEDVGGPSFEEVGGLLRFRIILLVASCLRAKGVLVEKGGGFGVGVELGVESVVLLRVGGGWLDRVVRATAVKVVIEIFFLRLGLEGDEVEAEAVLVVDRDEGFVGCGGGMWLELRWLFVGEEPE